MWLARNEPSLLLDLEHCIAELRDTHPQLAQLFEQKLYLPVSTIDELSELLGIPSSTVSDRLQKARAYLGRCLGFSNER